MQHLFDVEIAVKYGVNVATFIKNIAYWIMHNKANDTHFHVDRYWTYNTQEAFTEIFPYWSRDQIQRIITKCEKRGLLLKGNHNKQGYDRTGWYSLTDYAAKLLNLIIVRNRTMDCAKSHNGLCEIARPIPDINTDNKPDRTLLAETKKKKVRRKRKPVIECPPEFRPNAKHQEIAARYGLNCDLEFQKCINSHKSKGNKFSSWNHAFTTWLLNAHQFKLERETRYDRPKANGILFETCKETLRQQQEAIQGHLPAPTFD